MTDKEKATELLCRLLCELYGIEPYDSLDGSPQWWMFNYDVAKLLDDLEGRGFKVRFRK